MTTAERCRIRQMNDNDLHKGALEEDNPRQRPQARFKGQLSHRESDPLIKSSDTDFPEPGGNPEHSGEPQEENPEAGLQGQDPGHRQKRTKATRKTIR